MDWSNESYVKVFIRESADELRMGWEAWSLFQKVLRHSDRSGILEHDGDVDIPVLAATARMPVAVVMVALPKLLRTGAVEQREGHLFVVNKLDASEATKSNKQRQREKREKRRAEGNRPNNDTKRDIPTQNVSQTTRDDTARHDETQRDTHSISERSEAEQSRTEQTPTGGVSAGADEPTCDVCDRFMNPPAHGCPRKVPRVRDTRPHEIAQVVCGWIKSKYPSRRPSPKRDEMVKTSKALAKLKATDAEIRAGLVRLDRRWRRSDNLHCWGNAKSIRTHLPGAIKDDREGPEPEASHNLANRDITVGWAPPTSHEEFKRLKAKGEKF